VIRHIILFNISLILGKVNRIVPAPAFRIWLASSAAARSNSPLAGRVKSRRIQLCSPRKKVQPAAAATRSGPGQ